MEVSEASEDAQEVVLLETLLWALEGMPVELPEMPVEALVAIAGGRWMSLVLRLRRTRLEETSLVGALLEEDAEDSVEDRRVSRLRCRSFEGVGAVCCDEAVEDSVVVLVDDLVEVVKVALHLRRPQSRRSRASLARLRPSHWVCQGLR